MNETRHFTLPRKIVSAMTSESWQSIPHAVFTYEARVSGLLENLKEVNAGLGDKGHITVNTAMLRLISEALKASPQMNGHIHYRPGLVSGRIEVFDRIDVSLPMTLEDGKMITVTLRNLEGKSMYQIRDTIADIMRRARNSNLEEVMYDVAMHDTLKRLRRFRLLQALRRLAGALTDRKYMSRLSRKERKAYLSIPESERLSWRDMEQGTITVTNLGSMYREWKGECTLLEIIPPQLVAIALGPIRDGVLTMTIAFDHRALDAGDIFPFMRCMDDLLANPEVLFKK